MWIYRAKALYLLGVEKQMVISLKAKFMTYLLGFMEEGKEWWVELAFGSGIMDLPTSVGSGEWSWLLGVVLWTWPVWKYGGENSEWW